MAAVGDAQTTNGTPYLQKHGTATQLIVDGRPFLILGGELDNDTATSIPTMDSIWPKIVAGNFNTVLVGVSWAEFEPKEGQFNYEQVDEVIKRARENNLHAVFLWFASWKNGMSSYAPYWVKTDYLRFPRIRINDGESVSASGPVELLSTFGDATRDADAAAFGALMRHIKQFDGDHHTVIMMQVENEIGVLRDTRDRSAAANRAFAGPVPAELMSYLDAHKDSLAPELRSVWAANGYRMSGTWEEVFGPGKASDVTIPIETTSPPMSAFEHEDSWRRLHWPSDEIFMAWSYTRYVEKVVQAGKAGYDLPMYLNAWLQQPDFALPGTYPSGGPLPQVHDIWRAGAPDIDIMSPDLYLPYFDELCQRFSRNGNPLFIPESNFNAANAIVSIGKYNAIGFSPFGIDVWADRNPPEFGKAYRMLSELSPMILAHQGDETMTAVRMLPSDAPKQVKLGNYTLSFTYTGRTRYLSPQLKGGVAGALSNQPGEVAQSPLEAAALVIASGPDEFYFGGGGMRVDFAPDTPGPPNVGLGYVQAGKFVDGKWEATRWVAGGEDAEGEILVLHPDTIFRVKLYRFP
jgi:hypothetical protein